MANERDIGDHYDHRQEPRDGSKGAGRGTDVRQRWSAVAGRLAAALRSMALISRTDGVALMLAAETSELRAVGGSTAEGLELEYAQQAEQVGPAQESVAADHPVAVGDLERRDGPGYARLARRAAPVRAVLSVPVHLDGGVIGALNFYRVTPCTWTRDQIAVGEHLADTAADLLVRLAAHSASDDHGWP
ncbi:GAF domain-containing protein [Actinomadura graeca]|uniref:GAF domain-containing protein n=1 Tax=Actinomadura graeca TaxID=2750812 RepID=A0ABX8QUG7_9ACTN|nr:GAF domain-containing protein [Actinomadura graeca]QXJ22278.1 GAF domain-containing protein [Actinomadura graeca]